MNNFLAFLFWLWDGDDDLSRVFKITAKILILLVWSRSSLVLFLTCTSEGEESVRVFRSSLWEDLFGLLFCWVNNPD